MNTSLAIARREWHALFASPLAWSLLALVQMLAGVFIFLTQLDAFMQQQPLLVSAGSSFGITAFVAAPLFESAGMLLMFVIPLACMNSIAGERRGATLALLLSSPVSMRAIVAGKFLALLGFATLLCALLSLMPLSLLLAGSVDGGLLAAACLGLLLLAASYTALGLFISSLTRQPVLAAVISFGLLAVLTLLRTAADSGSGPVTELLGYLSLSRHAQPLLRGIVNTADLAYFILFISACLIFTVRRLDALRTHG